LEEELKLKKIKKDISLGL